MTTKALRIPLIIDANGKWCAYGWTTLSDADWPLMEEVADPDSPLEHPYRAWITVIVDQPEFPAVGELVGTVEPA